MGDADAIVIAGATATGKTALAVEVARRVGGEIISLDSRQLYRGMDIGTAKPTLSERGGIRHFGFDLADPSERFSAGAFAGLARTWLDDIRSRGSVPILTGGTGFFLRALTHPLFAEPALDAGLKERWKQYLRHLPSDELARWAAALNGGAALPADRQRRARLVEVAVMTGYPLGWWHANAPSTPAAVHPLVFVLDMPRDMLYGRIEDRVDGMVARGLVDEVRTLLGAGFSERDPGMNATGYIELIPHIRGERTLDEAVTLIRNATRRYARRQLTWLRNQLPDAQRLAGTAPHTELAADIARMWEEEGS